MKKIILSLLFLLTIFCISKFIFEPTHLYYELIWLDIPMHIIGGFGVTLVAWSILSNRGKSVSFSALLIAYFLVALVWELYEFAHDLIVSRPWNGWFDTTKDLFDGLIGTCVAYWVLKK